jgi:hypothetical protein
MLCQSQPYGALSTPIYCTCRPVYIALGNNSPSFLRSQAGRMVLAYLPKVGQGSMSNKAYEMAQKRLLHSAFGVLLGPIRDACLR